MFRYLFFRDIHYKKELVLQSFREAVRDPLLREAKIIPLEYDRRRNVSRSRAFPKTEVFDEADVIIDSFAAEALKRSPQRLILFSSALICYTKKEIIGYLSENEDGNYTEFNMEHFDKYKRRTLKKFSEAVDEDKPIKEMIHNAFKEEYKKHEQKRHEKKNS